MNTLIESLNSWGDLFLRFGWPMLLQSTVAIIVLVGLNWALRERVRAVLRHALLLLILVKLVLPPSLALPTGAGYWLLPEESRKTPAGKVPFVSQGNVPPPAQAASARLDLGGIPSRPDQRPPTAALSRPGVLLLCWLTGVAGLLCYLLYRLRQVRRLISDAASAPGRLERALESGRKQMGIRGPVRLRLSDRPASPSVCGLWKPMVLVPRMLLERLPPVQLKAVLLHELGHVKRGDLWANHLQTLLQILYWYNPLLWLANALIRRVREQAVDELVMVTMEQEAEEYPATLVAVAKLAVLRPAASLGLIGIAESRPGLGQRVHRLVSHPVPKTARLGPKGIGATMALAAVLLPMASGMANRGESGKTDPTAREDREEAATNRVTELLKEGRNLYESGRLAEARARLEEAVSLAPENKAARYYLDLVWGRQYAQEAHWRATMENKMLDAESRFDEMPTSAKRRAIYEKLRKIRLETVSFENLPLSEVLKSLSEEARRLDPEGAGINFLVSVTAPDETTNPAADEPATRKNVDVMAALVRVQPPLKNVTFEEALEVIVHSTSVPLKHSVEDYGVVISPKGKETQPLHVRVFKVDPEEFARLFLNSPAAGKRAEAQGLPVGRVPVPDGIGRALGMTNIDASVGLVRERLAGVGVDLRPPKALFYNDRLGVFMVSATMKDMAKIEALVQRNAAPSLQVRLVSNDLSLRETEGIGEVARVRLRQANEEFLRISNLFNAKPPLVSLAQFLQARHAWEIAQAEARGDAKEVARIRLERAKETFLRISNLYAATPPLVSMAEFLQARHAREIAQAEASGDAREVARIRWEEAKETFLRVSNLFSARPPLASSTEFMQAKNDEELAEAEWKEAVAKTANTRSR